MSEWWDNRSKIEKTAIVAAGAVGVVVVATATTKAIAGSGLIVVSGKTIIACGKVATIVAKGACFS